MAGSEGNICASGPTWRSRRIAKISSARSVKHFGRIDTLVCNAGYGLLRPVAETSPREMAEIFQTNVFGTLDCVRPAVVVMKRQEPRVGWRGQVVIVSSAVARRGLPYFGDLFGHQGRPAFTGRGHARGAARLLHRGHQRPPHRHGD